MGLLKNLLLPFAGRAPDNTAKGVSVDEDGKVNVGNFPDSQTVDGAVDSTVQNWPTKQQVNLSQDGTDNKVDVDFPASQTVDGTVGVNSLPALPAGTNKIGKVDVDNFPTSIEVENPTGESLDVQVTGSSIQVPADLQSHDLLRATALPIYDAKTYQWLSSDVDPTPDAADRVFGVEINTATHVATVKYWNGTAWEDLA